MSSSNIETSESIKKRPTDISPSPQEKKEYQTSSGVLHVESLPQSKSKRKEGNQVQTKLSSSETSTSTEEKLSSPIPSKKLSTRLKTLPKIIFVLIMSHIIKAIIFLRNRPKKFVKYPSRKLKRIAEPIDLTKKKQIASIVRKMNATLQRAGYGEKLGIAAPQIGINKRIIIVSGAVMINPEWHPTNAPKDTFIEACYSVPGRFFKVDRAPYGWAKWYSIDGILRDYKLLKMDAVIFQHELDHLNGMCCADVGIEIKLKTDNQ
jgi:peptide deformylase